MNKIIAAADPVDPSTGGLQIPTNWWIFKEEIWESTCIVYTVYIYIDPGVKLS